MLLTDQIMKMFLSCWNLKLPWKRANKWALAIPVSWFQMIHDEFTTSAYQRRTRKWFATNAIRLVLALDEPVQPLDQLENLVALILMWAISLHSEVHSVLCLLIGESVHRMYITVSCLSVLSIMTICIWKFFAGWLITSSFVLRTIMLSILIEYFPYHLTCWLLDYNFTKANC